MIKSQLSLLNFSRLVPVSQQNIATTDVPGGLESVPVAVVQAAVVKLDEGLAVAEVVAHVQTTVHEA